MLATLLGIVMLVRFEQEKNVRLPISVTPVGIVYERSVFPMGYSINLVLLLLKSTPFSLE